ncbi:MAG: FeoB-associated Cys-rich membrane protein [Lachnospiraceae bacterium]|nr:FeoB-associated Cys-rich membrane protein [Lachnospiraceae bacterium]
MLTWIIENLGTIIVSLILVAIIGLVLYSRIRKKRKGISTCGCGCSSCPSNGMCHKK